jgi:N-acetyl-gamma-glutamyl-phosphate/LysW-gamma-L-alpha-aminoadipyl-6-phosphate reductase
MDLARNLDRPTPNLPPPVTVAVVGASGYVGGELVRLLLGHPHVRLVAATANEAAGRPLDAVHPNLAGVGITLGELGDVGDAEVLFLALPNGETMSAIDRLPAGRRLVDTSADFRLRDEAEYEAYYKKPHACFGRVPSFTYGLPELFRARLREAEHVAAPGCFATATTLALYPLAAEGLCASAVVTAVTGSSGSGAKPKDKAHHPFRADSLFAYEPFRHRHVPEIRQSLRDAAGADVDLVFQPHSGPFARGIFATAVVRLAREVAEPELRAIYAGAYGAEPFVRIVEGSPNVKWVRGTNFCDVAVAGDGRTAVVTAAIDNLLKGAASQAVQAFNITRGFDETAGLRAFAANP